MGLFSHFLFSNPIPRNAYGAQWRRSIDYSIFLEPRIASFLLNRSGWTQDAPPQPLAYRESVE